MVKWWILPYIWGNIRVNPGKYTKIKQLSRKISKFRQNLVFTAKFFSLPLGGAAKFFTAKR